MKGLIKGLLKGSGVQMLLDELKKLTSGGALNFLDVNGDGKVDLKDIQDLQWETLGKIIALGGIIWAANHFGLLHLI